MELEFLNFPEAPPPTAAYSHAVRAGDFLTSKVAPGLEHFAEGRYPARTTVGVTALAMGCLVEVDLIARL